MKRWGTCAFWNEGKKGGNPDPYAYQCPQGFGGCGNFDKIKRTTHMIKDSYSDRGGMDFDMVVTENDEDWRFWTGKYFGCIHHLSKEVIE